MISHHHGHPDGGLGGTILTDSQFDKEPSPPTLWAIYEEFIDLFSLLIYSAY
ncbi:MAG: hypothetical protein ACTSQ8_12540 [Candidatus Helarchaeota archaeon]